MRLISISHMLVTLLVLVLVIAACGNNEVNEPEAPIDYGDYSTPKQGDERLAGPELAVDASNTEAKMESSFDSDGDGFMTRLELDDALNARLSEFTWPNGYTFSLPQAIEINTSQIPESSLFENGAEYSMIGIPHMCAWSQTWLIANQSGDPITMETAMDQLQTVTLSLPPLRLVTDYYQTIFEGATLGDIAPLQDLVDTTCDWSVFDSLPSM